MVEPPPVCVPLFQSKLMVVVRLPGPLSVPASWMNVCGLKPVFNVDVPPRSSKVLLVPGFHDQPLLKLCGPLKAIVAVGGPALLNAPVCVPPPASVRVWLLVERSAIVPVLLTGTLMVGLTPLVQLSEPLLLIAGAATLSVV